MANEEKRQQILAALEEVCRDKRFHEVTLDEVAQQAGVGKGTIYRYFADKEELFLQLVAFGLDGLCGDLQQYVDAKQQPFRVRMVGMCQTIGDFFQSRNTLIRMAGEQEVRCSHLDPEKRAAHSVHRQRLDVMLAQVLNDGRAMGELRTDMPVEVQVRLLMAMMRERNTTFLDNPQRPTVEQIVDLYLNGFSPR